MHVISNFVVSVFRTVLVRSWIILDRFRTVFFVFLSSSSSQHHFRKKMRNNIKNILKIFKNFFKKSFVAFIFSIGGNEITPTSKKIAPQRGRKAGPLKIPEWIQFP